MGNSLKQWGFCMQTHARRAATVAVAATLLLTVVACDRGEPTVVVHTRGGAVRVAVEVARTDAERSRGLMYRDHLEDGRGMLFVFEEMAEHPFWMKNTLIPLDMIHLDDQRRIVGIVAEATPLSTRALSIGKPSAFVLEVRGGFARDAGMAVGDSADLVGVDP
jgi:hypothetical protein